MDFVGFLATPLCCCSTLPVGGGGAIVKLSRSCRGANAELSRSYGGAAARRRENILRRSLSTVNNLAEETKGRRILKRYPEPIKENR
jgi:hypothetical protein